MRNRVLGRVPRAIGFPRWMLCGPNRDSPRVYFPLYVLFDVRRRAKQIAVDWQGWITWHADAVLREREVLSTSSRTDLALTIGMRRMQRR